jgi:hypothetical protein
VAVPHRREGEIGRRSGTPSWIAAAAAFFTIAGIWQHVAFLRLERRLAALRSAAP